MTTSKLSYFNNFLNVLVCTSLFLQRNNFYPLFLLNSDIFTSQQQNDFIFHSALHKKLSKFHLFLQFVKCSFEERTIHHSGFNFSPSIWTWIKTMGYSKFFVFFDWIQTETQCGQYFHQARVNLAKTILYVIACIEPRHVHRR